MKAKHILIVQLVLLAAAILAGALLKDNLADGPRLMHRMFGMLAAIAGLTSAIIITMKSKMLAPKIVVWISAVLTFFAGYAGNMLKTTSDYDKTFMTMRGSAVLAFVLAAVVLYMTGKKTKS